MLNRFRPSPSDLVWFALSTIWLLSFFYASSPLNEFIWCPWKRLTGLDCPGCGLTRSFCALSALDLKLAFRAHPAGPLLYLAMAWTVVVGGVRRLSGDETALALPAKGITVFWCLVVAVFTVHFIKTVLSWM